MGLRKVKKRAVWRVKKLNLSKAEKNLLIPINKRGERDLLSQKGVLEIPYAANEKTQEKILTLAGNPTEKLS